jgi:signal peptidase I
VSKDTTRSKKLGAANRDAHTLRKEPLLTQIASFVDLFVWLLVLKTFFLPLFIIPTGSMAETLSGAHATHTCTNCGYEYPIGFRPDTPPRVVQCPNCRYQRKTTFERGGDLHLEKKAGDRIVVHGWPFDIGGRFGPQRWDVVVFKNPNEPDINYIKRLIGLPGETIEIIDGDVFAKGPDDESLQCARKTPHAQRALWFPYYNHDYPPRESTSDWVAHEPLRRERWPAYHPRWTPLTDAGAWAGLDSRMPRFDGIERPRAEIRFVTGPVNAPSPGRILDVYGYNAYVRAPGGRLQLPDYHNVTDLRLSTDVATTGGDGYVELGISKYDDLFYARLYRDGRVTLERAGRGGGTREPWGETHVAPPPHPIRFALGHADYRVAVEIDGQTILASTPERYSVTPEHARRNSRTGTPPSITIAAERVQASFAHLLIERDVFYTSGALRGRASGTPQPGTGTQGNPITLKDDAYFMCGDNSPASHDSRAWGESELGPHLRQAYNEGRYDLGTVPADQLIGRAFLVYWPGFLPLSEKLPKAPNLLPDLGRVRWIH